MMVPSFPCFVVQSRQRLPRSLVLLSLLALIVGGCARTAEDAAEQQLEQQRRKEFEEHVRPRHDLLALAGLYLDWEEHQHWPPASARDLHARCAMDERALEGLQQGRYAFRWGMEIHPLRSADRSQVVLGYETTPSSRGTRWVVTADARVHQWSEKEFKRVVAEGSGASVSRKQ